MAIHKGKIRQRNSGGTYDYLLPETTIDMVNGLQDELDSVNYQLEKMTKIITPSMNRLDIQTKLDEGGSFKFLKGTYNVEFVPTTSDFNTANNFGLYLKLSSDTEIEFEEGVEFLVPANNYRRYIVLWIDRVSNIKLIGHSKIIGDKMIHIVDDPELPGEFGMGLHIRYSDSIEVRDLESNKCWGDGIHVTECINVHLENIVCDDNRRNGLVIAGGENIYVKNPILKNTGRNGVGTAPRAGIDIESHNIGQLIKNVIIENPHCENNVGSGIDIPIDRLLDGLEKASDISLTIVNPTTIANNVAGIGYRNYGTLPLHDLGGYIKVINHYSKGEGRGYFVTNILDKKMPLLDIDGFICDNWSLFGIVASFGEYADGSSASNILEYGGIKVNNAKFSTPPADLGVELRGERLYKSVIHIEDQPNRIFNAVFDNIDMGSIELKRAWCRWGNGRGYIKYNSDNLISLPRAEKYQQCNGLNITFTADINFILPDSNLNTGREYYIRHVNQSNMFRLSLENSNTDSIIGLDGFYPTATNYIREGSHLFVKSVQNGWLPINKRGTVAHYNLNYNRKILHGVAIPTSGTWKRGDIIYNINVSAGGIVGWVCVADGTPGSWKTFGMVQE